MLIYTSSSRSPLITSFWFNSHRQISRRAPKCGKPPYIPPSRTYLYRVVNVPMNDPADVRELLWRRHAYINAIVSLHQAFKREYASESNEAEGYGRLCASEENEFRVIMERNVDENRRLNVMRIERQANEADKAKLELLDSIDRMFDVRDERVRVNTELIRQKIEASKTFVTMENLDAKLEYALEHPLVVDYAIDMKGRKMPNPSPTKYLEGTPTRQRGRIYDRTLGVVGNAAIDGKLADEKRK